MGHGKFLEETVAVKRSSIESFFYSITFGLPLHNGHQPLHITYHQFSQLAVVQQILVGLDSIVLAAFR